jgi:hypothetical protein
MFYTLYKIICNKFFSKKENEFYVNDNFNIKIELNKNDLNNCV